MHPRDDSGDPGVRRYGLATLAGAGAFGLGYLLTSLVTAVETGGRALSDTPGDAVLGDATGGAWAFYNAHFVGIRMDVGGFGPDSVVVNHVLEGHVTPAVFLVPPLVLLVAGLGLARARGNADVRSAATTGAATALGYLPLAAIGGLLAEFSWEGGEAHPEVLPAILLAGMVYPVVFGGIGGALAVAVGSWRATPQPA